MTGNTSSRKSMTAVAVVVALFFFMARATGGELPFGGPAPLLATTDTLPGKGANPGKLQAVQPQEIVFLLDISNSMGQGKKMDLLRKSMQALLEKLRPVDRVSLISFGNDVTLLYATTSFSKPDSLLRIIEHIRSIATATNVNGAIDMAYEQMSATPRGKTRQEVFLVTDGEFKLNKRVIALVKEDSTVRLTAVIVGEGASAEKAVAYVRETLGLDVVTLVNENRDVNNLLEHIRVLTGAPLK
jgi:uncharacterized protein with von Willebrand factor type A (vWA) domain